MRLLLVLVICLGGATATYADLSQGLIGNWTFDDGTLNNYASASSSKAVGSVTSVPGMKGEALALAGNSYVEVSNVAALPVDDGVQSLTVSLWLNYQGSFIDCNTDTFLATLGVAFDFSAVSVPDSESGALESQIHYAVELVCPSHSGWKYVYHYDNPTGGGLIVYPSGEAPIATNQWYHIVYILNRSSNEVEVFYNGRRGSGASIPPGTLLADQTKFFTIGAATTGYSVRDGELQLPPERDGGFHGFIDELRIYNRVLSESEIQKLYTLSYTNPEPVKNTISITPQLHLLLN